MVPRLATAVVLLLLTLLLPQSAEARYGVEHAERAVERELLPIYDTPAQYVVCERRRRTRAWRHRFWCRWEVEYDVVDGFCVDRGSARVYHDRFGTAVFLRRGRQRCTEDSVEDP